MHNNDLDCEKGRPSAAPDDVVADVMAQAIIDAYLVSALKQHATGARRRRWIAGAAALSVVSLAAAAILYPRCSAEHVVIGRDPPAASNSMPMRVPRTWTKTELRTGLVEIPTGIIEHQARSVQITKSFAIGVTEVTQAHYAAVMSGSNPSRLTAGDDAADRPVEQVTFEDAAKYCNALSMREFGPESICYEFKAGQVIWPDGLACRGYRLPTEAEWALTANNESPPDGPRDVAVALGESAWYDANSRVSYDSGFRCSDLLVGSEGSCGTHPVGRKAPNARGVFDTSGNVREWVWDLWEPTHSRAKFAEDPTGPSDGRDRTVKGCGWQDKKEDCTFGRSWFSDPLSRHSAVGFRIARSLGRDDEGEKRTNQ